MIHLAKSKKLTSLAVFAAPFFVMTVLAILPGWSYAESVEEPLFFPDPLQITEGSEATSEKPQSTLQEEVSRILGGVVALIGVVAFVIFVYAGLTWMTAGGKQDKAAQAQKIMIWTAIGVLVIFASYAILRLVFESLTNVFGVTNTQ